MERYRSAAQVVVGRTIDAVRAPDPWYLKRGLSPSEARAALLGHSVTSARRRGKLLLLDTDGPILGLRFGMTGRLLVDGGAPVGGLEYGPDRFDAAWIRFSLGFAEGGSLRWRTPPAGRRRAVAGRGRARARCAVGHCARLASMVSGVRAPLKAALMDQRGWPASATPGRRDPVEGRAGPGPPRRHARRLGGDSPAAHHPADVEAPDGPWRERHRRLADRPPAGRAVPWGRTPLERRRVGGRTTFPAPSISVEGSARETPGSMTAASTQDDASACWRARPAQRARHRLGAGWGGAARAVASGDDGCRPRRSGGVDCACAGRDPPP